MKSVDTVIDHVTVYREGALIRRTGSITGDKKDSSTENITIQGLPLCLDDASVRAGLTEITGDEVRIRDIRVTLGIPEGDSQLREPENIELKNARRSSERLRCELSELENTIKRVKALSWPDRMIFEDPTKIVVTPLKERSAFGEYITERYSSLVSRRRILLNNLKKIEEDQEVLENREYNASSARQNRLNEVRKSVVLGFNGSLPPEDGAGFYLEYMVPGAKWAAAYGLRFDRDFSHSILESKALVSQYSGEDWNGVTITLSTALPHHWHELPELASRRIGRAISHKRKPGWKAAPAGAEELFSDFDEFMNRRIATPDPEEYDDPDEYDESEVYEEDSPVETIAEMGMSADMMEMPSDMMKSSSIGRLAQEPPKASRKMKKSMPPAPVMKERMEAPDMVENESSISEAMLEYDLLRQGDFVSGNRNGLKMLSKQDRYMEMLADIPGTGDVDLIGGMAVSESRAREVDASGPPSGCVFPTPVDGYDYSFNADSPVGISSDGRYHSIPLNSRSLPSSMRYVTVPREDCSVFSIAELNNAGKVPLMPGPVDIRVESDFLCTGNFDVVPAGGIANLGLGVEQGIKVARNTNFQEQTSGITGGNLRLRHEIQIEVVNNLSRNIDIEIRERVPTQEADLVKSDEKVKIDIVSIKPEWKEDKLAPDYVDGAYKWMVDIKKGEQIDLFAQYDINIPSNSEIIDGNNREAE